MKALPPHFRGCDHTQKDGYYKLLSESLLEQWKVLVSHELLQPLLVFKQTPNLLRA
jgi:hypothetical protein